MATRQTFQHELENLRADLQKMGDVVAQAIHDAVKSLATQNVELAQTVMAGDDIVDAMQINIEDKCNLLIARQQPMATDLRIISTGLKITTDLERIGDHAYDIANITTRLKNQPLIKPLVDIPRMAVLVEKMLKDSEL